MESKIKSGKRVLVRTYAAGVHFGIMEERNGQEIRLSDARRLWSWSGALSLSEIASKGLNISQSKISEKVEEIILPQSIEVILISQASNLP